MNATSKPERLEKTIAALRISLQESWGYFSTAGSIDSWLNTSKLPESTARFFYLTFEACIRSSISTLAGLISKNKDSININYFLNIATDSLTLFRFVEKKDIKDSIQAHKSWLASLNTEGAVGQRIIEKRDKLISHTDRKFATKHKPSFLSTNPRLDIVEVENVYKQLMQIINTYDRYYYGQSVKENELDMTARSDLDYVLRLVKEGSPKRNTA